MGASLLSPSWKRCEIGTGGSLGFSGVGCTAGAEGLLQCGRGVKRPWSRGAGEDRAPEVVCAVVCLPVPFILVSAADPELGDAG